MVEGSGEHAIPWLRFQYSLCRVVLMVSSVPVRISAVQVLSVLALSSRFDGLVQNKHSR